MITIADVWPEQSSRRWWFFLHRLEREGRSQQLLQRCRRHVEPAACGPRLKLRCSSVEEKNVQADLGPEWSVSTAGAGQRSASLGARAISFTFEAFRVEHSVVGRSSACSPR